MNLNFKILRLEKKLNLISKHFMVSNRPFEVSFLSWSLLFLVPVVQTVVIDLIDMIRGGHLVHFYRVVHRMLLLSVSLLIQFLIFLLEFF